MNLPWDNNGTEFTLTNWGFITPTPEEVSILAMDELLMHG